MTVLFLFSFILLGVFKALFQNNANIIHVSIKYVKFYFKTER